MQSNSTAKKLLAPLLSLSKNIGKEFPPIDKKEGGQDFFSRLMNRISN